MQAAANYAQEKMGSVPIPVKTDYEPAPGGETMKALAWFGNNDVRIIDAPVPDITQDDDVIVQVTGTTICGSDLHLYHGEIMTMQKGDILGHEFMGKVHKVGRNVTKFKPGQRVVAMFQIPCGKCEYCKQDLTSFCDNSNDSSLQEYMYGQRDAGFYGYSHFTGGYAGGQAEYVRVPRAEIGLLALPDEVPDEKALFLSDILPTSLHCVEDTGVKEGDTVGIWGLGPIGLCTARWCQLKGAKRIIGIDKVPARLQRAKDKLGIEIIDINEHKDVPKRLYDIVPRGLDIALDCSTFHEPKTITHKIQKTLMLETDVPETINEMIYSVRKQGRCGIIAAYAGFANGVNVGALMEKGVRLIGNGQAPVGKYWERILNEYLLTGKFDTSFIVTHRVPLDDFPKLYAAFDQRIAGVEKVFVYTKYSAPPSPGFPTTSRVSEWVQKTGNDSQHKPAETSLPHPSEFIPPVPV